MINWKNNKVLVCGGCGMIGSHLARELLKRGANVTIADNLSSGSLHNIKDVQSDLEFCGVDLRDPEFTDKVMRGKDSVFQLAADMGGITYITNVGASLMVNNTHINLNSLMAAHVNNIENYYFSSSACVYANYKQSSPNCPALKEEDASPAEPNEFYGWEKLYCEKLVESFQKDFGSNIRVGRFHNIYGSAYTAFDDARAKAPCKMILGALRGRIEIWNDGEQTRSFLHIDDCIEAILRLMDSSFGNPINIGSERLISMNDLAATVKNAAFYVDQRPVTIHYCPDKPQGVRGRNSDNTLVRKVLAWEPEISLEDGLMQTYVWAKEHFNELEGV